jgi:hypothetical protein
VAEARSYGNGHRGSNGVPDLSLSDRPVVGETVVLRIGNSRGALTSGLLFLSLQEAAIPTPLGGTLLVVPFAEQLVPVPANGLGLPFQVPGGPQNCGLEVYLQIIELDPGASAGVSFSRGLRLRLGV